jgi:hypothetical protein
MRQQMKRKIEREKIVLTALLDLSLRILDHVSEHDRVSIGDMVKLTGASRNTLKQQFRKLVEKKVPCHAWR